MSTLYGNRASGGTMAVKLDKDGHPVTEPLPRQDGDDAAPEPVEDDKANAKPKPVSVRVDVRRMG